MDTEDLLRKVDKLGFSLLGTGEEQDANATLSEVVKSKNLRLWEGFPVILANAAEREWLNYDTVKRLLKIETEAAYFDELVAMSLALYHDLGLKFPWDDELFTSLPVKTQSKYNEYVKDLKESRDFKVGLYDMTVERLKTTFKNYFKKKELGLNNLLYMKEELGLEYAMSQVFSAKQKELFLKKLRGEKLTKTEKEYYSRTVRKKVSALANSELHRLARKLLER